MSEFYDNSKFNNNDPNMKRDVIRKYCEIIQWGLEYYYKGTKNWRVYYPFNYAPLLCDMVELTKIIGSETISDLGE